MNVEALFHLTVLYNTYKHNEKEACVEPVVDVVTEPMTDVCIKRASWKEGTQTRKTVMMQCYTPRLLWFSVKK